jgi:Protein of unknown function, DUF547
LKKLLIIAALLACIAGTWWIGALPQNTRTDAPADTTLLRLPGKLLYAVKLALPSDSLEKELASLNMDKLISGLSNDEARKTFWINSYNAFYQLLADREKKAPPGIYTQKLVTVAGHHFSLDDIEHGILRKYRWKYSMGYLPAFLPSRLIKKLAVSTIDYRIHFTLNCGAKSCPPISFYEYEKLNAQLNTATRTFLRSETSIDTGKKELHVSSILKWFKGDFGGEEGIRSILSDVLQQDFKGYSIHYNSYDWSSQLHNFNGK